MSVPVVSTKLHIPILRPRTVFRPRLIERLNAGMNRKLTLLSASAGSGKTTLLGEWLAGGPLPAAWLSLDETDNDPVRFWTSLIAALRTIAPNIGEGALGLLRSPQPPSSESIAAMLLHEIDTAVPSRFALVLDDYHEIGAGSIDGAVALLIERMPPRMHLVVSTREDPRLPLARLRVRDQLTELRAADLRFTLPEADDFLGRVMGLDLGADSVALLESRTEGWIAGLQLAALSLQGRTDPAGFIRSFSGSHPFVLDYLTEEVLRRQPASVQSFLLRTSVLDRLCGPLCDAVVGSGGEGERSASAPSGQDLLEALERANLFLVPLDSERRWYRYHHLFGDLLRKRLLRSPASAVGDAEGGTAVLHVRASVWYEENGHELEAFRHAAAAGDTRRAARLLEGNGMPLLFRGAVAPVRGWLDSLPREMMDAAPALWVTYASALLMAGELTGVEPKLQAAERALEGVGRDEAVRDLIGHIASIRAALAVSRHDADAVMAESRRALEHVHPDNLPVRTATAWALGYALQLRGDRAAAGRAYAEALAISEKIGHAMIALMAALGLGHVQEAENRLPMAAETYRRVLDMAGDAPPPAACEAQLGLARLSYEWNDLDAALRHAELGVGLANRFDQSDRVAAGELMIARVKLAQGETDEAAALLEKVDHDARRLPFANVQRPIAAVRSLALLRQGSPEGAARLAREHDLPVSLARVRLAQGDPSAALAALAPLIERAEASGWEDERLRATVVQAVALYAHGEPDEAFKALAEALAAARPGGFVRTFVDEGAPMYRLLREASARGTMPDYAGKLLAAFGAEFPAAEAEDEAARRSSARPERPLVEPLSERELEVLRLVAQGLSNREIGEKLFIALSTVKGHNRIIFDKLQVKRRTEAVALARSMGLLRDSPETIL
ncbi:LuxR C-terminal-related transcriptional regulator [Paenibacillus flagellatus]|uniref:LuxR family transcriptional regulator n=1 Tax=Paenibacillus flagellatus TaxID=2211139 RepID=A0A2V5KB53_9BACL|nr:LuxR C-terminal-related transcriptional regulator [Paenibacillus flagellatus]PYI56122.1 LuxR family transcriptional regulator [Paenibacillus flagellatus]